MAAALTGLLLAVLCTPRTLGVDREVGGDLRADDARLPAAAAQPGRKVPTEPPAKGRFLIASRSLGDPNFSETVILLLAYEAHGAMGVVINRPTEVRLASAFPDIEELRERSDRVYLGGPVAANMMLILIRSAKQPRSSDKIFGDVYASGSRTTLRQALGKAGKTNHLRAYVGHAGWGPGQLDREIARGDWYVASADAATVFDATPSAIWPKLIDRFSGEWAHRKGPPPRRSEIVLVHHARGLAASPRVLGITSTALRPGSH